jgi:cytochrome P450
MTAQGTCVDVDEAALPELDVRSDAFRQDPYGVIRRARARGPLARSHRGIEVLSFDLCAAIFSCDDFETLGADHFREKGAPPALLSFVENGLLLNADRDRHDRVRRVMFRALSIRRVDEQREVMRAVATRLLEPLLDVGTGDFVRDFTERYPMEVLCRLLGVPAADIPEFHRAAIDLHLMGSVPLAPGFPRLQEALELLWNYVDELVQQRRAEPRDDFISALISAQVDDARLSDEELVWNLVNLLFAGQDTTRYQLASTVRELAAAPELWDALSVDSSAIPAALEEAMRLRPVSQFVVRRAEVPVEIDGHRFPPGRRIILNLLAASRDPATFPAPATFDLRREPSYRLPFGWGTHYCLGHALARAEMCEALEIMTQTMERPTVGKVKEASAAAMLGGPEMLEVSVTRRTGR